MSKDSMKAVFDDISAEIEYQYAKWGVSSDDTVNSPNDWIAYISEYSTRHMDGSFPTYNPAYVDEFRISMVKTAALAVAAIMSLERQRQADGHAFYEKPVDDRVMSEVVVSLGDFIQNHQDEDEADG